MSMRLSIKIPGQIREVGDNGRIVNITGYDYYFNELPSKKKNARHLLLLHGFAGSTYTWEKIDILLNEAGFYVWSLDMKGFGWSDKPLNTGYDPISIMEDVRNWLEFMDLKNITLVGNSFGGGIAMLLALTYPSYVDRLVLIDPGALRMKLPNIMRLVRMPLSEKISDKIFGRWMVKMLLKEVMFNHGLITDEQVDNYYRRMSTPNATAVQVALSRAIDFNMLDTYTSKIGELNNDTLILWGENDRWIPVDLSYKLLDGIRNSRLVVIKECGHLPQEEKPDVVLRQLLSFMNGKSGTLSSLPREKRIDYDR
jgi:pimeloyl-ACP methyl ester carboxylesterase